MPISSTSPVLKLPSGQLGMITITFLAADDEHACDKLIIGRPVLENLHVDTHTLLDIKRSILGGEDCPSI